MDGGATTIGVSTIVWLLIAVLAVAVASKYLRVPYTVALVVAGLAIALTGSKVAINLTPELILFIFLPALLFESAYNLRYSELRENIRPITLLAVPGVLATAFLLAAGMHYLGNVSWGIALLFGAIMAATDPVSVLATFRQIGAPRRLSMLIEGESLFNDGTALVLFRILLGIVLTGAVGNWLWNIGEFVIVIAGAVAVGAATGYLVSLLLSRMNDYLVETTMTVVVAYGTYLLAEQLHVSGVIAVVTAALVIGNYAREHAMSPTTRISVSSTWEFFGFIANSLIFLLIGLEISSTRLLQYWPDVLLAIALVLVVRAIVVVASAWVSRYIHAPLPRSWQAVMVWGGLRGSLSLAMALSLPLTLDTLDTIGFPDARHYLLVVTFGVILFSLLVQALTMKPLLQRLGLITKEGWREDYEMLAARKAMAGAAVAEIERISASSGLSPASADELRAAYAEYIGELDNDLQSMQLRDEDLRRQYMRQFKRHLLQIEKSVVQARFTDGAISEEPMRRIITELDAQIRALDEGEDTVLEGAGPELSPHPVMETEVPPPKSERELPAEQ
jgi:CPA1 family monovalent cation:H+ antiporter